VTKKRTDPILTVTKANELYLFNKKVEVGNLESEIRKALQDAGSDPAPARRQELMLGAAVDVMSIAKKAAPRTSPFSPRRRRQVAFALPLVSRI
jgi:hypothetical protein